jgi:purine nucleosidase
MKILLDTDIGSDIDDALALLLLLRLPDVKLLGVTTVYGCTDIRAKVCKKILVAAGHKAPVFAGASTPLQSTIPIWHAGTEGRGVLNDDEFDVPLDEMDISQQATEFIVDTITSSPGEVTLVSLGALTNVAKAIIAAPEICTQLARCYFMGAGITYPTSTPRALEQGTVYFADESHNVRCDVEAARIVFKSPLPITVLTNDVTTKVWWDDAPVQRLMRTPQTPESRIVSRMLEVWLDYRTSLFGRPITGTCPHDPLTVAEATGYGFASYEAGEIQIAANATTAFVPGVDGRHAVAKSVKVQAFTDWFSNRVVD